MEKHSIEKCGIEKDAFRSFRSHSTALLSLWLGVLLGAALPVTACADPTTPPSAATQAARPQQGYVIPITRIPDHGGPLVHIRINDKIDATFIVDTGSNTCAISEKLATKLGLKSSPALKPDGKPDTLFGKPARDVTLTSITFAARPGDGALILQPIDGPFGVISDDHLLLAPGLTVDGIIGANLLTGFSFAVYFDFNARQMILITPGVLSEAQARQLGCTGPGGAEIPLTSDSDNDAQFFASALLATGTASRSVSLLVDTGGKMTIIPRDAANALSLTPMGQQPLTGGTYGYTTFNQTHVSALSLGDIRLADRPVLYPDKKDFPAVLGMDILGGYKVLMDFPAHKMYLMPQTPLAPVQVKPATPPATSAPASPPVPKQP